MILVQNLPVPFDRRVWQEACALRDAGYAVSVVCPSDDSHPAGEFELEGVAVSRYRAPAEARFLWQYPKEYSLSLVRMFGCLMRIAIRRRPSVIQVCNPPDILFVLALPFKAVGVKLVFDHHDLTPELAEAKGVSRRSLTYRVTRLAERLTYVAADVVIATNQSYADVALTRGGKQSRDVFIVRSSPDLVRFEGAQLDSDLKRGKSVLVAYVGVLGSQENLPFLLDVAEAIAQDRPDFMFMVAGGGPELDSLRAQVTQRELEKTVEFLGRVPQATLNSLLATADICVNVDAPNELNNLSTMNKIVEYMAFSKPIVQFDLKEGRYSAGESSLYVDYDVESFATALVALADAPEERERLGELGRRRLDSQLSWSAQVEALTSAYARVLS